ncbi:MAG: hypothetical protein SFY70_03115 [Bacteroidia bacterium]|nr:hypothetical protein [Bacteroidia bacterium]
MNVYRGISPDHPAYAVALIGRAYPRGWADPAAHEDIEAHVAGNTHSKFMSWTWVKAVAIGFARGADGSLGVVLRTEVAQESVIFTEDVVGAFFNEAEVLLSTPVLDARVLQPPDYHED